MASMKRTEVTQYWEANAEAWTRHARAGYEIYRETTGVARIALVAKGRFLAIASKSVLKFGGWESSIKILPIDLATKTGAVGIITLKNRTLSPVARLFIDCAREVAKPMAMSRRRQLQKS
jgi:hypothetical protein